MRKKLVSILLALCMALALLPATATAAQIPEDAAYYDGSAYKIYLTSATWAEAKQQCEDLGGHLATITSQAEQDFIEKLNSGSRRLWIGGYRDDGNNWNWVTGEPWDYTHWAAGEPNNSSNVVSNENCIAVWPKQWNDLNEKNKSEQSGFICEWDQEQEPEQPAATETPAAADTYNGHSYLLVEAQLTWTQARDYAESLGGYLACITSAEEQEFISSLISGGTQTFYWIGATDEAEEGVWTWVSGEPFVYSNWASRQPDNYYLGETESYVGIARVNTDWARAGKWNDFTNTGAAPGLTGLVIEWDQPRTSFGSEVSPWASPEMEKAYEMKLIPEILVGEDLTQTITRLEFAAVSVRTYEALTGTKLIPATANPFEDCSDLEVLKAYAANIVSGTSETTFSPDLLLNREQAATMLTRVFKRVTIPGWTLDADSQFSLSYTMPTPFADDGDISDWARDSVYFMAANGIINGISGNRFAPKNVTSAQEAEGYANATREQALAIAVRMVEKLG